MELVWSTLLLTLTGAVAWWLTPLVNRERLWGERKVFLALHLTMFFLLHAVLHQTGLKEKIVGTWFVTRVDRVLAHHFESVRQHPNFAKLMESVQSPETAMIVPGFLGLKGIPRLNPDRQAARTTLLNAMIESAENTTLCTNLLRGTVSPVEIEAHLNKLSDEQLHLWSKIRAESARAVLDGHPAQTADKAEIRSALAEIAKRSSQEDFMRLVKGLLHRDQVEPAEACWVLRTLYGHINSIPAPYSHYLAMLLNH